MKIEFLLAIISLQVAIAFWRIIKEMTKQSQLIELFRPRNVMKGHELIFISKVSKKGDAVELVDDEKAQSTWGEDDFKITCISMYEETYIAHGMATYIVKLKKV